MLQVQILFEPDFYVVKLTVLPPSTMFRIHRPEDAPLHHRLLGVVLSENCVFPPLG